MKKSLRKAASPERARLRKVMRKLAREQLRPLREEILRTGSGLDVLRAISVCAMRDVVMPEWLAIEFMKRYRSVTHARVASWDEAFGRPYPKGAHLSTLRTERKMAPEVYRAVNALRRSGKGIGKMLFEEVGEKLGLSATQTDRLYYQEKRLQERLPRTLPRKS